MKFQPPARFSIQEIMVSFELQPEDMQLLTSGCRKRYLTNVKVNLIKKALDEKYTFSEIAACLNMTQPALSQLLQAHK